MYDVAIMSLQVRLFGTTFQNPVLLAAGTCGFGRELADVVDLEALGGLVTKSVTVDPRAGNPPPRVSELPAGMLNSVGLANPGVEVVRREKLPWLRDHLTRARVLVSLAGRTPREYESLVSALDDAEGFLGFELNLSCPNDTRRGGPPFALDPDAVADVVGRCRRRTGRPLVVKLSPADPDTAATARVAADAGADGLTLVNTLPGLDLDPRSGRPRLGAGSGGMSGPALRPVGVRAVEAARGATDLPVLGVGGILCADDALQYLRAGASLVQIGTASFARPRAAEAVVRGLARARAGGVGGAVPGVVGDPTAGKAPGPGHGLPGSGGDGPDPTHPGSAPDPGRSGAARGGAVPAPGGRP